ncbi:MAG: hypothetical protein GQ546_11155 [Gammaproteobacteria bacterium]|nr:hypothetical protein [Gammaproteobacteria bacterium]
MKILNRIAVYTLFITSLISTQQMVNAQLLYPVDILYQPTKVRISKIKIERHSHQLVLSGIVKRRAYNSHVLPGHIDYIVFDVNDQVVAEGAVNFSSSLNLRRLKQGVQFSFLLPNNLSEGSYIKVGWNRNHMGERLTKVTHYKKSPLHD